MNDPGSDRMALTSEHWAYLLQEWRQPIVVKRRAQIYTKFFDTASDPRMFKCDDGKHYVLKSNHLGKSVITEQIAGRLGALMGAPVAIVDLVELPQEFADEPAIAPMQPGIHHGSRYIEHTGDRRQEISYRDMDVNLPRFSALALFYGWFGVFGDHQVIYRDWPPKEVSSVDHGELFEGGSKWTAESLRAAPPSTPDELVMKRCQLEIDHLKGSCDGLVAITNANIASAITAVPEDWGFPVDDQVAIAMYLERRREELLASVGCTP